MKLLQITHHNHPKEIIEIAFKPFLELTRDLKLQGFNAYRKRFNLAPYTSFEEFTGDKEFAAVLEDLYGHIDAMEYYVGMYITILF